MSYNVSELSKSNSSSSKKDFFSLEEVISKLNISKTKLIALADSGIFGSHIDKYGSYYFTKEEYNELESMYPSVQETVAEHKPHPNSQYSGKGIYTNQPAPLLEKAIKLFQEEIVNYDDGGMPIRSFRNLLSNSGVRQSSIHQLEKGVNFNRFFHKKSGLIYLNLPSPSQSQEENQDTENVLSSALVKTDQIEQSFDEWKKEQKHMFATLQSQINDHFEKFISLTKQVEALEELVTRPKESRKRAVTEIRHPDQKSYPKDPDFDTFAEAYEDYKFYVSEKIIADRSQKLLCAKTSELIVLLADHYKGKGTGKPLDSLIRVLSHSNDSKPRQRFWVLASLGFLASQNSIARTSHRNGEVSDQSIKIWCMENYTEFRDRRKSDESSSISPSS